MKVTIYNSHKDLKISKTSVTRLATYFFIFLKKEVEEVIIHFVSTKKISNLHEKLFQDPSPTDCISQPYDFLGYALLGEVFICPETAIKYSEKKGKDPYEETSLYVVHSLLHLLGYDDIDPKERKKMRRCEKKLLTHLKEERALLST